MIFNFSPLAIYWSVLHISAIFLYFKKTQKLVALVVSTLTIPVYLTGKFTGDIANSYIYGIDGSATYDLGFMLLIKFGNMLGFNGHYLIYIIQGLVFFLTLKVFIKLFRTKDFLIFIVVMLLSVYPFLAVNNVIRQGLSSCFILFGYIYLCDKRWVAFIINSMFATFLHWSAPIFISVFLGYHYFSPVIKGFILKPRNYLLLRQSTNIRVVSFVVLVVISVAILVAIFPQITSVISRNSDRYAGILKILSVTVVFYISNSLIHKKIAPKLIDIYSLRIIFFSLFSAFSLLAYPELAARILFFYFFIEMLFIASCLRLGSYSRFSAIVILLSYSFAFNVLQLITNLR